jgi:hypothetical protein
MKIAKKKEANICQLFNAVILAMNVMMKYLFVFLFFVPLNTIAQCNCIVNEQDEFTGNKRVTTGAAIEKNFVGATAFLSFKRINNSYYLKFQKSYSKASLEVIRKYPPKKYRIYLYEGYLEDKIKQKHWREISNAAKCILKVTG